MSLKLLRKTIFYGLLVIIIGILVCTLLQIRQNHIANNHLKPVPNEHYDNRNFHTINFTYKLPNYDATSTPIIISFTDAKNATKTPIIITHYDNSSKTITYTLPSKPYVCQFYSPINYDGSLYKMQKPIITNLMHQNHNYQITCQLIKHPSYDEYDKTLTAFAKTKLNLSKSYDKNDYDIIKKQILKNLKRAKLSHHDYQKLSKIID